MTTVSDHRKTRTAAGPASRAAPPGLTGPPPGEAQASLSHRSRGLAAQSAWRAEGAGRPEPSSRPTRRRRSRPVGQPAPEGNDSGGQHRRPACRRRRRPIASSAGAEGAGADPRRNGDDYPMTSLSDGLGPQKDPNSGRREASRRTLWSRCVAGPFCATTYGLLCDEVTCPWPVDPLDLPWHAEPFLP